MRHALRHGLQRGDACGLRAAKRLPGLLQRAVQPWRRDSVDIDIGLTQGSETCGAEFGEALVGFWPAMSAYRTDVAESLGK